MMKTRRKQALNGAFAPLSKEAPVPESAAQGGSVQLTETRIYIGLNDAATKKQLHQTDHYMGILKEIRQSHKVAFSVDIEDGGYYHENGEYTEETSFVLVLIDIEDRVVASIAKELCARFNQETVLVTQNAINAFFVNG